MGIPGFGRFLQTHCMKDVSILDLMKETGRNVIVVDGFNFYGQYVYPEFDWICGGIKDLVERVREFVDPFKQAGIELEFFFVYGNLDDGIDTGGSKTWVQRHSSFVEYTKKFFAETWPPGARAHFNCKSQITEERKYYHTPFYALSEVLFALIHILKCKVHFDIPGVRTPNTAYYARNNAKCLGLLAQDNYYLFYKEIPPYLSLSSLNLKKMTTQQYCAEMCARHLNLHEEHLYPVFITPKIIPRASHYHSSESRTTVDTPHQKRLIIQISTKLNECDSVQSAREKIRQFDEGTNIAELFDLEEQEIDESVKKLVSRFFYEVIFYKYGDEFYEQNIPRSFGPLRKWTFIKILSLVLYKKGYLNYKIVRLLRSKTYCNDNILEDFKELPPSSFVYQPLRQKLYGILYLEEEEDSDDDGDDDDGEDDDEDDDEDDGDDTNVNNYQKKHNEDDETVRNESREILRENSKKVREWCMTEDGCFEELNSIDINPINHPGLLELWKVRDEREHIQETKWILFAKCISNSLNYQLLRKLPKTLVIPTAVLYFLYHEVPYRFKKNYKVLQSWEIEVFIAQAVMLPKMNKNFFSKLAIKNKRERIVKLAAAFVYGCHTMQLLVQVCGFLISEYDQSLWHYFDGNFFHSLYEKAEWRRNAEYLCDNEARQIFKQIKQIILPQTPIG